MLNITQNSSYISIYGTTTNTNNILPQGKHFKQIAIKTLPYGKCWINNQEIQLNKNGILELNDIQINTLSFLQTMPIDIVGQF